MAEVRLINRLLAEGQWIREQLARQQQLFAELERENADLENIGSANRQHLECVQHALAVAQDDLNVAQLRLHTESMKVDELETELETAHQVHQDILQRHAVERSKLQRENADLRSDNERLGNYHQEQDDYHRQQLESVQQESAEALDARRQLQLRLHEAHQLLTQDIRDQHAVELSKLKRDKGEQQLADWQHLEFVQHELAKAHDLNIARLHDLDIARAAAWDLNVAQVRLHSQSMRVDELETELETAHQVHQRHAVDIALLVAAKDRRIKQLEFQLTLQRAMSTVVKPWVTPAVDIIDKHGPLVALAKFSLLLYAADERAKPAVVKAGGMKSWLQRMPELFELHGEGQPGYERVSLSGSAERAPTEAGLKATARMSDGAGPSGTALPVCQGSDAASSGATSDEKVKMYMGRAAARRDGATGDTRRMLNDIVHVRDKDPHKHGHNRFIDEATGRRLEERMRAELGKGRKVHRAKSAPRGRPSADQVLAAT
eukprot:scaffold6944_cov35-Phaeocystis_antarctica.AAC.3